MRASREGRWQEAERHLAEAVRVDSRFLEARIELGALHAESGEPERALDYFNGALSVEPKSAAAYAAKAGVLVMLNRPGEAEQIARQALILDPGSIASHYILGTALLMQNKLTSETASHLETAASRFPRARAYLESLQKELGRKQAP